jgi:hypothetical protein
MLFITKDAQTDYFQRSASTIKTVVSVSLEAQKA